MSTDNICPQCHAKLPPDAPAGLCPRCLIRSAAGLGEPPPDADFPDIGDAADVARRLPQFEILSMLGQGGMGVVYKARQPTLDRIVALKILPPADALSPDFVERFRREARALAKLSHPNIVAVHECGESGGLYYFVMEYVDGANLRALLEDRKLTPAEALAIVPRVCDALEYAHEEGVIHRDIKPENLLIDRKGRVKIADFGLAKLLRREPLDVTLTVTGTALGTMRYMAPEQLEKPESVDHRADIYSLGVVIYEMLTGEVPMGRFAPPSERAQVDVRLDEIVLRSLERDVERRYQHASEVKTAVEKVTQAVATPPPAPVAPPAVSTSRSRLIATMILGALVVMLSFMPWGNAGKSGFEQQYSTIGRWELGIVPLDREVNAWDSSLAIKPIGQSGHWYFRVPAWIVPLVALAIIALAASRLPAQTQRAWTAALAMFGAVFTFVVISAMVFHGYHDAAMLGVFFVFIALLFKSLIELITARMAANDAPFQPAHTASLLVAGLAGLMPLPWAGWFFKNGDLLGALTSLVIIIGTPASLIIIAGALALFANPSSRFGRSAIALAMLPCYAGVVLGLPAGLCAMFRKNYSADAAPGGALPPAKAVRTPADLLLLVAGIALLTAVGIGAWLWAQAVLHPESGFAFQNSAEREVVRVNGGQMITTGSQRGVIIVVSTAIIAGYGIFIGWAGLLLRRLRARLFVLLCAALAGLFLPAALAFNFLTEHVPQWPMFTALWIGMPVCVWAIVVLLRDDVREAFASGIYPVNASKQPSADADGPRLSRCALIGVIWAFFGLLGMVPLHYFMRSNEGPWIGGQESFAQLNFAMGVLLAIGAGAPIGSTILGAISVATIKRSGGTLYGMPFAACSLLFYPLLLLGAVVFIVLLLAYRAMTIDWIWIPAVNESPPEIAYIHFWNLFLLVATLAALTSMFFAGRAAWTKISGVTPQPKSERAPGAWTPLEITAVVATTVAFLLGAANALFDLAQNRSPLHGVTLAGIVLAAVCAAALLVAQQFHPAATPARAAMPELFFPALAACTGGLAWTRIFGDITGWNFWHGAAFAGTNFLVALFLLVATGANISRTRAIVALLTGLAGFALILWWNAVPVTLIGDRGGFLGAGSGPMTINSKPVLAGAWLAAALAVLTSITGALRLRAALATGSRGS